MRRTRTHLSPAASSLLVLRPAYRGLSDTVKLAGQTANDYLGLYEEAVADARPASHF